MGLAKPWTNNRIEPLSGDPLSGFDCTEWLFWMPQRIWRETKMQPSTDRSGHHISCRLFSLHFLCDILTSHPVWTYPLHKLPSGNFWGNFKIYWIASLKPFLLRQHWDKHMCSCQSRSCRQRQWRWGWISTGQIWALWSCPSRGPSWSNRLWRDIWKIFHKMQIFATGTGLRVSGP